MSTKLEEARIVQQRQAWDLMPDIKVILQSPVLLYGRAIRARNRGGTSLEEADHIGNIQTRK
jgi:hypothetical protein